MFTALLARWQDVSPPPTASALVVPARLDGAALFEGLACEVHVAALRIAAVASALNALAAGAAPTRARAVASFVPHRSAAVAAMRQCQQEMGLSPRTVACIDLLYRELEGARRRLDAFQAELIQLGPAHAANRGAKLLAAAWRGLARVAIEAVDALDRDMRWRLTGLFLENTAVLTRLLRAAAEGRQPCLNARGDIFLPTLPQRRSSRRFALLQNCTVRTRGGPVAAFARDVSANGMGLEHVAGLTIRQPVEVELRSGRRLSGRVVWIERGRAGIEFHEPLAPSDPLIAS